jgi:hypothetical protein
MSNENLPPTGEIILYQTEDGQTRIECRFDHETLWLSQVIIAELFQKDVRTINEHLLNIFAEGELKQEGTIRKFRIVRQEGTRQVTREIDHYNLDAILSVGYRVRSERGIQFRQWATTHLKEYLVKGFVMDDARLKVPGGHDYFDEWLERIREIRASEKRFYQKVRDIYATAVDYDAKSDQAQLFFKKVQNKMLWAITQQTAAELIVDRADPKLPNMGLTSWNGSRVRQKDVIIAKNYLNQSELDELNRIVVMYLDYAEGQAKRRKTITMQEWAEKLDAFLSFNEQDILNDAGKISAQIAEKLVLEHYTEFDRQRREAERIEEDAKDLLILETLEASAKREGSDVSC